MLNHTETLTVGSRAPEFFVAGRESGRNCFALRFLVSRNIDCGVTARHVVTELRETHGSVGADESRNRTYRSTADLYRRRESHGRVEASKVSGGTPCVVPFSARRGKDRDYSLRAVSPDWNRCAQ